MKYKQGWNIAKTKLACNYRCNLLIKKESKFYYHRDNNNKIECENCRLADEEGLKKVSANLNKFFSKELTKAVFNH